MRIDPPPLPRRATQASRVGRFCPRVKDLTNFTAWVIKLPTLQKSSPRNICFATSTRTSSHPPKHALSRSQRHQLPTIKRQAHWHNPILFQQSNLLGVPWQTIKICPIKASKALQFI